MGHSRTDVNGHLERGEVVMLEVRQKSVKVVGNELCRVRGRLAVMQASTISPKQFIFILSLTFITSTFYIELPPSQI